MANAGEQPAGHVQLRPIRLPQLAEDPTPPVEPELPSLEPEAPAAAPAAPSVPNRSGRRNGAKKQRKIKRNSLDLMSEMLAEKKRKKKAAKRGVPPKKGPSASAWRKMPVPENVEMLSERSFRFKGSANVWVLSKPFTPEMSRDFV
uniref:Ribosome biogenesis protein NOP53 n=1 Tax=Panagrellus redivivus TaxID=6233 RepID=A0A7E4UMZ5_PANRE